MKHIIQSGSAGSRRSIQIEMVGKKEVQLCSLTRDKKGNIKKVDAIDYLDLDGIRAAITALSEAEQQIMRAAT